MKEQLIDFETAKLAKEKGFDWETDNYFMGSGNSYSLNYSYNHNVKDIEKEKYSRPNQPLLQRWLRELHGIFVIPDIWEYGYCVHVKTVEKTLFESWVKAVGTWETLLETGLYEALEKIYPTIEEARQ